jgi:two-component system response regulator RegA
MWRRAGKTSLLSSRVPGGPPQNCAEGAPARRRCFETFAEHERNYLDEVLAACGGRVSEAARVLGLHRRTLQRKLNKGR